MSVVVEELRKSYGQVEALRGISFEIRAGEIFSGATSWSGLVRQDSGSLKKHGMQPGLIPDHRCRELVEHARGDRADEQSRAELEWKLVLSTSELLCRRSALPRQELATEPTFRASSTTAASAERAIARLDGFRSFALNRW